MEYLKSHELPWEYAQKAYDDGHYIEAIQIVHGFLENKLQELLLLVGATKFNTNLKDTWDLANQIPFLYALKTLFILGQLNIYEYNDLLKLNRTRNKIIHQKFSEPFEKINQGYSKIEFDLVFKKSIDAIMLIDDKTHAIIN